LGNLSISCNAINVSTPLLPTKITIRVGPFVVAECDPPSIFPVFECSFDLQTYFPLLSRTVSCTAEDAEGRCRFKTATITLLEGVLIISYNLYMNVKELFYIWYKISDTIEHELETLDSISWPNIIHLQFQIVEEYECLLRLWCCLWLYPHRASGNVCLTAAGIKLVTFSSIPTAVKKLFSLPGADTLRDNITNTFPHMSA
jgi:hypothetical protein